jgi:hypothetical protein
MVKLKDGKFFVKRKVGSMIKMIKIFDFIL